MNTCSFWPDRWGSYDLTAACMVHDEDYENQTGFVAANNRLRINATNACTPFMGWVMWIGTTLFGWPFYIYHGVKNK